MTITETVDALLLAYTILAALRSAESVIADAHAALEPKCAGGCPDLEALAKVRDAIAQIVGAS